MSSDNTCSEYSPETYVYSPQPDVCLKKGILDPSSRVESAFNSLTHGLIYLSAILTGLLAIPICVDIVARTFFGVSIEGIIELETLALVPIAFCAVGYVTVTRQHIQIDLFYNRFSLTTQARLALFSNLLCMLIAAVMTWRTGVAGADNVEYSSVLHIPIGWAIWATTLGLCTIAIGMFFQFIHVLRDRLRAKDYIGIFVPVLIIALLAALPFIYRASGYKLSGMVIGGLAFLLLFAMMLLRVPISMTMMTMALVGLLCLKRTPIIALSTVGEIPYLHTADFVFVAIPMFMLMGELAFHSGISADLFECANRWLGRLPGGLAVAAVGGCAGFGAVCGESLPTVITMSSVALPPMRDRNYDEGLAAGALAAGGTLGILIPPSIGFIFYSIITEESVGKLFIAGIIPGLLLTFLFMLTIIYKVKRNPSLAPKGDVYSMRDKVTSLVYLLPMAGLFMLVIGGILNGNFTPGEGGAVGAMGAFLYACARRRMNSQALKASLMATVTMCGKIFIIFAGVYCFGAFLASSRLPNLLAETIIALEVNRYAILAIVVFVYILLGCVMNILPMMLLTLPSIYPTIQALGFDGIWFGVITVILMEMGLITPPVGMNVFTLASLSNISMETIFKGVLPFFLAMLLCAFLIILFPGIATWLPNLLLG